ncbi:tRNA (adenosine(37)-N6)-dimethylallyltransferase MiaA [Streptomyces gamaensis]|uniref:tRNA dimethylallyltransferase n=1 Tax=Streptomyces gamaensis TaxID=1763542 RepID=A0ABW0Z4G0_9ACTN
MTNPVKNARPPAHPAPRVIAVVGATAAGKSDLGVALARHLGGEVVNADSMQLYRGMDIGTAKLTLEERQGVPHHLLDIWDVTETASVAEYQRLARAEIDRLLAEGRTPVLVGGSGLYIKGTVDDLDFPGTDPAVRARLEAELAQQGPGALHARLAAADPAAARAILPGNGRRIVRALEVIEITGRPFTANLPGERPVYDALQIGVDVARPELDERIALRVDRMWEAGLVDEVRRLEREGLREGRTASRALGYQQVLAHLAGECTEDEARAETVRATKRFARRQDSWFRKDSRVHWLSGAAEHRAELPELALALVERAVTA